ncbi:MAG TPA: hypothetical protein VJ890_10985, partial [Vineibacter sp.]|nr:hypothetical protein [Vineibacter sp.]
RDAGYGDRHGRSRRELVFGVRATATTTHGSPAPAAAGPAPPARLVGDTRRRLKDGRRRPVASGDERRQLEM